MANENTTDSRKYLRKRTCLKGVGVADAAGFPAAGTGGVTRTKELVTLRDREGPAETVDVPMEWFHQEQAARNGTQRLRNRFDNSDGVTLVGIRTGDSAIKGLRQKRIRVGIEGGADVDVPEAINGVPVDVERGVSPDWGGDEFERDADQRYDGRLATRTRRRPVTNAIVDESTALAGWVTDHGVSKLSSERKTVYGRFQDAGTPTAKIDSHGNTYCCPGVTAVSGLVELDGRYAADRDSDGLWYHESDGSAWVCNVHSSLLVDDSSAGAAAYALTSQPEYTLGG